MRNLTTMKLSLVLSACALIATALANKPRAPSKESVSSRRNCTVLALGNHQDDVPQILQAFEQCNNGGRVVFPEGQTYWIASKLNPILSDVVIDWHGIWQYSDNLNAWRNNSYHIEFQNHWAGAVFTGDNIHIDGYGTGGIDGNGDLWYTDEAGNTKPGRPMPFVFWNVSEVTVSRFFVKQPQLWSLNIMSGTNMAFNEIYCNATATKAPWGKNWVQNTDGFDTMDVNNVWLENFVYQGGDDCVAIKPRSYNVNIRNATCRGGNGIAVGSLGQYLEDSSVENLVVDDVTIIRYNDDMENGAYIKTWIGEEAPQSSYESAGLPRGGGWGVVRNVLFSNFHLQGANSAAAITQDSGNNGSFSGTSNMQISNIEFANFTGWLNTTGKKSPTSISISYSERHPCFNIAFDSFNVTTGQGSATHDNVTCKYVEDGGVHGETCNNPSL